MGKIIPEQEHLYEEAKFEPLPDGSMRAELTPEHAKQYGKFKQLQPTLQNTFNHMKQQSDIFNENYIRLLNQIEISLLKNVWQYFFDSNYYAEWAQKNFLMNNLMFERMRLAQRIIAFVQNDKTIDMKTPSIKQFIDRWKNEIK